MRSRRVIVLLVLFFSAAALGFVLVQRYGEEWFGPKGAKQAEKPHDHEHGNKDRVELTPQGFANLQPDPRPLKLLPYERNIEVPGLVVDRPGLSDRGVPAPVAGIVTEIHTEPGVAVAPGELLFTLRINSEYLQNAQAELFKTAAEMDRNRKFRKRLAEDSVVPQARLIDLDQQYERLEVSARAHTQDLLSRGLSREQIASIERGDLIREVRVVVPSALPGQKPLIARESAALTYEVQELKVEVGQKVEVGEMLVLLSNHHSLLVEGRALAQEAALIEMAARRNWPLQVEFIGDDPAAWTGNPPNQTFTIRYVSNTIDTAKRQLVFQVPLVNQEEAMEKEGRTFLLWRYRPGQRVRLKIPVERWDRVFVVPASAIVKEGPEVYVFRQNGDGFDRKSVRLLYEDRTSAVLDPKESDIGEGQLIAFKNAAVLNRVLKSQAGEGGGDHGHEHPHPH